QSVFEHRVLALEGLKTRYRGGDLVLAVRRGAVKRSVIEGIATEQAVGGSEIVIETDVERVFIDEVAGGPCVVIHAGHGIASGVRSGEIAQNVARNRVDPIRRDAIPLKGTAQKTPDRIRPRGRRIIDGHHRAGGVTGSREVARELSRLRDRARVRDS